MKNTTSRTILVGRRLWFLHTLLLQFLHWIQTDAKWIQFISEMPFEALKWVLLKLMYYALYLNVPSRTIELGFSWEIKAFDICTVRFSQKPFRRNSIYCSFHLHQKACSPFLQCIYALRVYLCTIWKLKRCSSSKRHDKEQDERTLLNKCITAINGHIYISIAHNKLNDYLHSEQYEIPSFIRSL